MRPSCRSPGLRTLPRFPVLCAVTASALLLIGCATTASPPPLAAAQHLPDPQTPDLVPPAPGADAAGLRPVTRYGRYTLIELVPELAQRDLMQQIVEVTIPPSFDTSVGDALQHVLLRSGFRQCDSTDAAVLYALPLPAAHLHLGPLALRDVLLTLAGPAWDVSVDEGERRVCFKRRTEPTTTDIAAPQEAQP